MEKAAENIFQAMFACLPNEAAAATIGAKPALLKDVYAKLLPELRGRAFTVAGITRADTLQRIRDRIADLPRGGDWREIREDILTDITPFFVDASADIETRAKQQDAAERRAELLIRHHGFQAYQAGTYEIMDRQRDALPYWQYITVGDDNVRDEHRALDGVILPADSPFWRDHFPPWDWGCRCQVVPLDSETVDRIGQGEGEGRLLSPREQEDIATNGRLALPSGQVVNVAPRQDDGAYRWHPADMRIPVEDLRAAYDPAVFGKFEREMKTAIIPETGSTVWDWLNKEKGAN
jgi:SPP1 gp7 family putative phage head morphogenesis protein